MLKILKHFLNLLIAAGVLACLLGVALLDSEGVHFPYIMTAGGFAVAFISGKIRSKI